MGYTLEHVESGSGEADIEVNGIVKLRGTKTMGFSYAVTWRCHCVTVVHTDRFSEGALM